MQITYLLTAEDQRAKLERYVGRSPHARWFPVLAYLVICALLWSTAGRFYIEQPEHPERWMIMGSVSTILMICLPRLYRWYQASFFAQVLNDQSLHGLAGFKTLTLSGDGIEERGEILSTSAPWSGVLGIEQTTRHIFIVLAPLIAIAVPATAFASTAERDGFVEVVQQHIIQRSSNDPA